MCCAVLCHQANLFKTELLVRSPTCPAIRHRLFQQTTCRRFPRMSSGLGVPEEVCLRWTCETSPSGTLPSFFPRHHACGRRELFLSSGYDYLL